MNRLLRQYGVGEDPYFADVLRAAWAIQRAIGSEQDGIVSRSSLLYAAVAMSGVVRETLRANGFDRRIYEEGLGIRADRLQVRTEASTEFPVHEGLRSGVEWYTKTSRERPFDAIALAAVLLHSIDGPIRERVTAAGLKVAPALNRLTNFFNPNGNPNFVGREAMDAFELTGSASDSMVKAIAMVETRKLAFGSVTTSILVASMIERQIGEEYSGPDFLRRWVERRHPPSFVKAAIDKWLRFYRDESSSPERVVVTGISVPLLGILHEAREIAHRVSGTYAISGRHLVGAIIATRHLHTGATDFMSEDPLSLDVTLLARDFVGYLERWIPRDWEPDDFDEWRRLLYIYEDTTAVAGFDAEGYQKNRDFLGTGSDVRAFAKLIASDKLKPPLSVGLFGDWGSGKSYFMRQLQDEIDRLARRKGNTFCKSVVQIEFNAWHYVEANLWASLVQNIFQNLKTSDEDSEAARERTNKVIEELGGAIAERTAAESAVQHAQTIRDEAANTLAIKVADVEKSASAVTVAMARDLWQFASKEVDEETRAKLSKALDTAGIPRALDTSEDIRAAFADIRDLAQQGSHFWTSLAQRPRTWWLLFGIALGAPALALLASHFITTLAPATAQIAAMAAGGATWLATQVKRTREIVATVMEAKSATDTTMARAEERRQRLLTDEEEALRAKTAELEDAKKKLDAAEKSVKAKQETLLNLRAGRQLARFIDDRAASDDYRKLLGVLASVRNDFEKLTYLMGLQSEEGPLPPSAADLKPLDEKYRIDRIVLYVDDLDRCPPNRVVEVLQAVHLLLAFPLFVVIVGVDARWVRESLRYKHRNLWRAQNDPAQPRSGFVPGYDATPDDYLEKIFQIPFWLSPMTPSTTRRFVTRLLAGTTEPDEPKDSADIEPLPESDNGETEASERPEPATAAEPEHVPRTADQETESGDTRLLTLRERELRFMTRIADLFGRSPRSIKRYLNTYRIIRAGVGLRRLDTFLDHHETLPDYRAILILLAIVVGTPKIAFDVFSAIEKADPAKDLATFGAALKADDKEWRKVAGALEDLASLHPNARVQDLAGHVRTVRRYSFQMHAQ